MTFSIMMTARFQPLTGRRIGLGDTETEKDE
jgi:hypothetical protein